MDRAISKEVERKEQRKQWIRIGVGMAVAVAAVGMMISFMQTSVRRKMQLGESNFEYVEFVSGLDEGDEVVVSDMSDRMDKGKIKLK
jgi:hypothetical protein